MLSIIIPTLNEEDYLPLLLDSIKKQSFLDYEIIVSDAGSKDKTLEIAKRFGCAITKGGLPARGRNNGAKIAKGDLFFFLDADTVLTDHFLESALEEFNAKKLDIASFCLSPEPPNKKSAFLLDLFYNKIILATEKILPHSAVGILIKRGLFEKLNGYDETVTLAEDHDLGRRAAKIAKFGLLKSVRILVSDRRFKKDGWLNIGVKYFLCELHTIFIGPVKSDIFHYKFDHYKDEKN